MQQAGKEHKRRWRGRVRKGTTVRTPVAQLEGFITYFTSTFYLYTNKPWALVCPPEVTFSMISEYSGTEKAAEGGWLPADTNSVAEPHQMTHKSLPGQRSTLKQSHTGERQENGLSRYTA